MNLTPDTPATGNGGSFGPREAAALLDQATRRARRQFEPAQPWLLAIRAILVLAALGAVWLSVRGQHPYKGPGAWALLIVAAFVIVNYAATVAVRARATAGIRGKTRFTPAGIAVMAAGWAAPYVIMAGLGVTRDSQSAYLLTVPLIVAGLVFAVLMAMRADWRSCGVGLAVAVTGAVGVSVGQAGAWAVTGAGLCLALLGSAVVVAWQLHRA
ncbi:MAG TPA: hypothetical protein VH478_13615 [Trebonia sp.]|jgi:hypothetical protein|nr:hypothetical protein [Trebonia sp.]